MAKVRAEGIPQHTEIRMIDGVERVFVVRELPLDPETRRTTITSVKGEAPAHRSFYVRR